MKQFLTHTARVLGFALGLIVILIAVSFVMKPKDNTERAGMLSERAYGFLAEPENSLDELFAACDFITVHVPMNDKTRGMIGRRALSLCKKGVRILNYARGGLQSQIH